MNKQRYETIVHDIKLTVEPLFAHFSREEKVKGHNEVISALYTACAEIVRESTAHLTKVAEEKIVVPAFGIVITITYNENGDVGGSITSDLLEGASGEMRAALSGIESMVLSHACAGVSVDTPAYVQGLEDTADAISNHYQ